MVFCKRYLEAFLALLLVSGLLLVSSLSHASIDTYQFKNDEQRHLYQKLTEELRCPKCQNQNLADSESQIAVDLRKEIYQQLQVGKSEREIIDFMSERYGDFVLYKPRLQSSTLFLWLAPVLLVLCVAVLLWRSRRAFSGGVEKDTVTVTVTTKTTATKTTATKTTAATETIATTDEQESVVASRSKLSTRSVNVLSLLALLMVAVAALQIYRHLGSSLAVQITELGREVFSHRLAEDEQVKQQALLLEKLDAWLVDHPDDERFMYMRARLLSEAGLWERAESDYRHLVSRFPDQDNFFAEYAQVLFLKNDRRMTEDARVFLSKALELNADNVTALGLLGMAAFEEKNYRAAADFWERLLRVIPVGTPQATAIAEGVAKARELGGLPPVTVEASVKLSVRVSIDAAAQAGPDETVFVLLRAKNGPRMPLAAVKTTVAGLHNPVLLDTATSPMMGQMDLSAIDQFEVVARLSRSGQPVPSVGDWEGVSAPLQKSSLPAQLDIVIDRAL